MDNQNVSNNMTQQPVQYYGESDEQKAKRAGVFAFMWLPTILYAVFYYLRLFHKTEDGVGGLCDGLVFDM